MMNCDKNGVSAYDLINTSKKLGFESCGIKCKLENLIKGEVKLPCIAHTIIDNKYLHYVVIEKVSKDKIVVNDFSGIKKYTYEEFNNIWTNILIILKPTRRLDVIKEDGGIKLYLDIILKNKKSIFIIVIISFITIFLSIFNTYYLKLLMEIKSIDKIFYIFMIIVILKCLFDFIKNRIIIYIDRNIDLKLSTDIYNKLLSLPYYYFNSRQTGDIVSRINDVKYIKDLLFKIPFIFLINSLFLLLSIFILVNISKKLFFILLIFIIIYLFIYKIFSRKNNNYIKDIQEVSGILNSKTSEVIDGINTVKNNNAESYQLKKLIHLKKKFLSIKTLFENHYNLENLLKELLLLISINTILYIGMTLVYDNIILIGDLILFNSVLIFFVDSLKGIFELEDEIKNGINSARRIKNIINHKNNIEGYCSNNIECIDVVNLNFCYKNDDYVLKSIFLNIKNKEKIVVIGSNGSGKSTLFKLLIRENKVNSNSIYINNTDINLWNEKSLRENICYITQNEKIFEGSIYENISLGEEVDKTKINNIFKITKFDEVLINKRMNLYSYIEENGSNFSLGEKQRLILSRCLLRSSNIIILDEALNGLDILLEEMVIRNILNEFKNKTIIYITQRVNNIKYFDRKIDFNELRKEKHAIFK
jgi:ATP-binding cassette subfamily B protein